MKLSFPNITAIVFALLFFAGLTAFAAWSEPSGAPPGSNLAPPITPTATGQVKLGGLMLNNGLENAYGLIVEGINTAPNPGVGVTGQVAFTKYGGLITKNEKLEIGGDFRISGIIKPEGNNGTPGQILTRAKNIQGEDTMEWTDHAAWLTVMGNFSHDSICSGSYPSPCASLNTNGEFYEEYATYCIGEQGYSVSLRVCKKVF